MENFVKLCDAIYILGLLACKQHKEGLCDYCVHKGSGECKARAFLDRLT